MQNKLISVIEKQGADFVCFVDVSSFRYEQNKGYPTAILFGIVLSKEYINRVAASSDYVEQMKRANAIEEDEFHKTEIKTDEIADYIESYISSIGFKAYSQSEDNIAKSGYYDSINKHTPLPHKTIAGYAGLGWIGKHNLLITPKYGSAISMCSVLTDAPLLTEYHEPQASKCGDCNICVKVCKVGALKGEMWELSKARDKIVNVFECNTCFQCVVNCPWTKKYILRKDLH